MNLNRGEEITRFPAVILPFQLMTVRGGICHQFEGYFLIDVHYRDKDLLKTITIQGLHMFISSESVIHEAVFGFPATNS